MGTSRVFKEVTRLFKGVFTLYQRCFYEVSRVFKDSVECVSRNCHKGVSKMFVKFCCCMDLIAATQAEGGLVFKHPAVCYYHEII